MTREAFDANNASVLYRAECDYFNDCCIEFVEFPITKRTLYGVWISADVVEKFRYLNAPQPRFVRTDTRKRYAYFTKSDALVSLFARESKKIEILAAQLKRASEHKAAAERLGQQMDLTLTRICILGL